MDKKSKRGPLILSSAILLLGIIALALTLVLHQPVAAKHATIPKKIAVSSSQPLLPTFDALMGSRIHTQALPVIGAITVPEAKVNLPIFLGDAEKQITYGAGTVSPTAKMGAGNYSLASHHVFDIAGADSYLFSPLTAAKVGMMIDTTDGQKVYEYKITGITQVPNTDGSVLNPVKGKTLLTLIYCLNLTGPTRVIVRAELVKSEDFQKTTPAIQAAFAAPWNQVPSSQLSELGVDLS